MKSKRSPGRKVKLESEINMKSSPGRKGSRDSVMVETRQGSSSWEVKTDKRWSRVINEDEDDPPTCCIPRTRCTVGGFFGLPLLTKWIFLCASSSSTPLKREKRRSVLADVTVLSVRRWSRAASASSPATWLIDLKYSKKDLICWTKINMHDAQHCKYILFKFEEFHLSKWGHVIHPFPWRALRWEI